MRKSNRATASPKTKQRALEALKNRSQNGTTKASLWDIAEDLGVHATTAHRAICALQNEGAIVLVRRGTGRGYPSEWRVS